MKKFAVLEAGSKAQVVLNATEWYVVHTLLFSKLDYAYDCVSFYDDVGDNHERTVIGKTTIKHNWYLICDIMHEVSRNSTKDFEAAALLAKANVLLSFCMHTGANLAVNFVDEAADMHVFSKGWYLVGDLSAIPSLHHGYDWPNLDGVYEIAQTHVASFKIAEAATEYDTDDHGKKFTHSSRVGMIRRDYVQIESEMLRELIATNLLTLVHQRESFRVSKFLNPLDVDSHCYSFGDFRFDVPVTKT